MRTAFAALLASAALLAGCATTSSTADRDPNAPDVTVTRDGDQWSADYVLPSDAPAWAFIRSALARESREPWRLGQWTLETPGVVLERRGHLDVIRSVDGGPVPRRLRFRLTPRAEDLEADYDPALVFTDGSVAMFSGHFDVIPLISAEQADSLPLDLKDVDLQKSNARVTWRDRAGPVLFEGRRRRNPVSDTGTVYVLFGRADLVDSPRLATVIDPGLPSWIGREVGEFAPKVADYYARRLGPGQTDKPTIMVSWNGPTPHLRSMGGSVLPGLIIMAFEGDSVVEPSTEVADHARWFIGHESAHFWLGQTVGYERSRDSWITEGGSDLMAMRAMAEISPTFDVRAALQEEVDDCIGLADEPVGEANSRGEHRAYYACGAVFSLVAEGFQKRATGGDWFDFLKPLIDANREDGVLTRAEWFEALDPLSGDPGVRADMETLLDRGSGEAATVVARLLDRAGISHRLEDGKVRLT